MHNKESIYYDIALGPDRRKKCYVLYLKAWIDNKLRSFEKESGGRFWRKVRVNVTTKQSKTLFNEACVRYFLTNFYFFYQTIDLQQLWMIFFISSKKLFLLSRYSNFCISVFASFSPCQSLLSRLFQEKFWSL